MLERLFNEDIMLNVSDMIKSVFSGWKSTERFIVDTQDEENKYHFQPEYLITVKIADRIRDDFCKHKIIDSYSIVLEEKTNKAFTRQEDEFVAYKKHSVMPIKHREVKESKRRGRVDIVIYKKDHIRSLDSYRTVSTIEIKNYNGYFARIQRDIDRIEELKDRKVLNNSFEFGIMTFIVKPHKKDWELLLDGRCNKIEEYKKRIYQKLKIKDGWAIYTDMIYKRYSDQDSPNLQYVYIIVVIVIK